MDIMQQLEEVDKKIAEAPAEAPSDIIEEPAEPAPSLIGEEPEDVTEEEQDEEEEHSEPEEPKEAKTATDYVKERRSKRELEQELINARAQIAAMQAIKDMAPKPQEQKAEQQTVEAPNPNEDPDAYRDWLLAQQAKAIDEMRNQLSITQRAQIEKAAKEELAAIEAEFSKKAPDYAEVMADAERRFANVIKAQNPNATDAEIKKAIEQDKLMGAITAYKSGQNPAEAMYNRVKALFNYTPAPKQKGEADRLAAVAANKKKSASGISGQSSSGTSHLSKEALYKLTPAEYAKLTDKEKELYLSL